MTDVIYNGVVTTVVTSLTAGLFALVWFVLPLARKSSD